MAPEVSVLIVDDNSPDGTGRVASVSPPSSAIEVIHRAGKAGLGAAYRHGFRHALDSGADVIAQMDADFSHDPEVLPQLIGRVRDGADVSVGSRYVPGGAADWTWFRRQLSGWGNGYARAMLRLKMRRDHGVPRLSGAGAGEDRHRRHHRQRLPVPDRDGVPPVRRRRRHRRGPDHVHRSGGGASDGVVRTMVERPSSG